MVKTIYENIYDSLEKIIPDVATISAYRKLTAPGYMDLNIDVLEKTNDYTMLALSHYYKHPSGDLIPDPDMEVRVASKLRMAEAMAYQDCFGYRRVYYDFDPVSKKFNNVDARAKKDLNEFLLRWLTNIYEQGHKLQESD